MALAAPQTSKIAIGIEKRATNQEYQGNIPATIIPPAPKTYQR